MQKDVTEKFMAYFRVAILVLVLVANAIFHLVDFEYGWLIFIGNIFFLLYLAMILRKSWQQ